MAAPSPPEPQSATWTPIVNRLAVTFGSRLDALWSCAAADWHADINNFEYDGSAIHSISGNTVTVTMVNVGASAFTARCDYAAATAPILRGTNLGQVAAFSAFPVSVP